MRKFSNLLRKVLLRHTWDRVDFLCIIKGNNDALTINIEFQSINRI